MTYTSLHNHSMYSILDGFPEPEEYLKKVSELGLRGFAITEHGNQYSWIYFDEIKSKYPNIKMIYGVELYETFDINIKDKDSKYFHLIALCRNEKGRIALNEIITKSNFEGFYYKPRVDLNMLKPYANDLIISSACLASKLARETDYKKCIEYINEYKSIFPYFYLEMQSHKNQKEYNQKILQLSQDTNTPFIITTDSHAVTIDELKYQAKFVQIARDDDTISQSYEDCYLQSEEEIHTIMDVQIGKENVSLGLLNTNKINDMIENINMPFKEPELPHFPLPEGFNSNYEYLKHLIKRGWYNRNFDKLSIEEQKERKQRLDYELNIIHTMDFDGYFLIVWDFINYAKSQDIAIGAGRGSASGSLVCFTIGITNLDPIKYKLLFERFLNPERISMPDIDIDVGDREKLIDYLINKYGIERVCQIINFSYITPKVAIKDAGRILNVPYKICDEISNYFVGDTFEECIKNNPNVLEKYKEYPELFNVARKFSGKVRQVSIHACGLGIVNTKITDYMAMKLGEKNEHVIQLDKKMIEKIGIVKIDILGVNTLNIVQTIMQMIDKPYSLIDINNSEFENDKEMYKLLCSANTDGVFQVESQGMKDLLLQLKPQNIEEVSAVLALYRPDTMKLLNQYILNKYNVQNITYIHNDMKPILENTYGCMIYQEELMEIVKQFGGRTMGGADKFRKGIGKKDKKLVQQEADKLYGEIKNNNYSEELAKTISDDMAEKGGYMFNKSHSFSYAVLTLQTAYLKSHYPLEFMTALLNANRNDNIQLSKYINSCISGMKIKVLPPNINLSDKLFSINQNAILFGLSSIKGIGDTVADVIIKNRIYKSFTDFLDKTKDSGKIDKSTIIALIKSGAFTMNNKEQYLLKYAKSLIKTKDYIPVISLPTLKILKEKWGIDTKNKQERLELYNKKRAIEFQQNEKIRVEKELQEFKNKYMQEPYMWEFETLSMFLTNNPFEKAYTLVRPFANVPDGKKAVVIGTIINIQRKKDKNNNAFCYLTLYTPFEILESICWSSKYSQYQELIKKGNNLSILGRKGEDKLFVEAIKPFEKWKKEKGIA